MSLLERAKYTLFIASNIRVTSQSPSQVNVRSVVAAWYISLTHLKYMHAYMHSFEHLFFFSFFLLFFFIITLSQNITRNSKIIFITFFKRMRGNRKNRWENWISLNLNHLSPFVFWEEPYVKNLRSRCRLCSFYYDLQIYYDLQKHDVRNTWALSYPNLWKLKSPIGLALFLHKMQKFQFNIISH